MEKLGSCCVSGCCEPAVELAAPDVPYCYRHAAQNRQSTAAYMRRMDDGNLADGLARAAEEARRGVRVANYGEVCCHACPDGVLRPTERLDSGLPALQDGRLQADADGAIRRCECGAWQSAGGLVHAAE